MNERRAGPARKVLLCIAGLLCGCCAVLARDLPETVPSFHEQFIYSVVTLESGVARLVADDDRPLEPVLVLGTLLKMGAVIEVDIDNSAQIRLACGSLVRLAPGSRLRIRGNGLELLAGAVLARHVGGYFPLKIDGAATLLISKDSLVDAERQGDKVLARVQVGRMQTPGLAEPVVAGQSIEAVGRSARVVPFGPVPRSWIGPSGQTQEEPPPGAIDEDWDDEISSGETEAETSDGDPGLDEVINRSSGPNSDRRPAEAQQPGADWLKDPQTTNED